MRLLLGQVRRVTTWGCSRVVIELKLPNELAPVNPVFHVSILKKCICDPVSIFPLEGLSVDENLFDEEVQVEILNRQVKMFRN